MTLKLHVSNLTCPGCTCGACAASLINALEQLDNITNVKPDFEEKTVILNGETIDEQRVFQVLQNHQYQGEIL